MLSSSFASLRSHLLQSCFKQTYIARIPCSIKRHFNTTVLGAAEFQHSKLGSFYQDAPSLENQFLGDVFLRTSLKRILPLEVSMLLSGLGREGGGYLVIMLVPLPPL